MSKAEISKTTPTRDFWESRRDNELWFGGKLWITLELRPDINLQQKRHVTERFKVLLNTTRQTPETLLETAR